MNSLIEQHFDAIELSFLQSSAIATYQIIRREISLTDGKLRLKATLSDGGVLELFEYVIVYDSQISLEKYSFHWQDAQGKLLRRWDNAPHHVHQADGNVAGVAVVPNALAVLAEIERAMK